MRLAPVPLSLAKVPTEAVRLAGTVSKTTRAAPEPVDALRGQSKERLLAPRYNPVSGVWEERPLGPRIDAIASGSLKDREPPEVRGTGSAVHALEAALWAFWTTDTFEAGALAAVNFGNDADTTGAIYGQLAGAHEGVARIPVRWRRANRRL